MCVCVCIYIYIYIYMHLCQFIHSHCTFSCVETYAYSSKAFLVVMLVVLDEHSFD